MKKDIQFLPVNNVKLAIAREGNDALSWKVYLINANDKPLESVMISSKGYGEVDGERQETSTLRHAIEKVEAESFAAVEAIQEEVFHLSNEFFVSYYIGRQIFDKKFIFAPNSIQQSNLSFIEALALEGVLHS